jgi:hypothetical protein
VKRNSFVRVKLEMTVEVIARCSNKEVIKKHPLGSQNKSHDWISHLVKQLEEVRLIALSLLVHIPSYKELMLAIYSHTMRSIGIARTTSPKSLVHS